MAEKECAACIATGTKSLKDSQGIKVYFCDAHYNEYACVICEEKISVHKRSYECKETGYSQTGYVCPSCDEKLFQPKEVY